jgi:hypothetical protein
MAVPRKQPAARAAVRKAAKPEASWVALFDEDGVLIGITDPKNITPVSNGKAKPKTAPAPTADLTPVPPGEVGTPADAVGKSRDVKRRADAVRELRKGLYTGTDPVAQNRLAEDMNAAAITVFQKIHPGPPTRR